MTFLSSVLVLFCWAGSSWYIHMTVFSVPLVTVSIFSLWLQTYAVMFSASSSLKSSTLEFQGCMITLSTHPTSILFFLSHSSTALKPQTRDSFQSPSHSSSRSCCLMLSPNPSYLFPSWSCCVMFSWGGSVVFLFPLSCWRGGDRGGSYKRGRRCCHTKQTLHIQRDNRANSQTCRNPSKPVSKSSTDINFILFDVYAVAQCQQLSRKKMLYYTGKESLWYVAFYFRDTMEADKKTSAQTMSNR